jgi:hypothetical protein
VTAINPVSHGPSRRSHGPKPSTLGSRRLSRTAETALLLVGIGTVLFVLAWARRSEVLMFAGAIAISAGAIVPPISLAARNRISTYPAVTRLMGLVLVMQLLHTVEHVVQLTQNYRLDRPGARSLGIVSALNVEWVHFGWNWLVWACLVAVFAKGMRGGSMLALFAWVTAHSIEHTYMLVHYLNMNRRLDSLGLPRFTVAETLPGFFGRDGWLALNATSWRPTLGPLASAPRVTVHFWWNVGELFLLALAVFTATRSHVDTTQKREPHEP